MTSQPVSQFEEQFSRLSAGEQLFLLERLARHCQLADATHNASHQPAHGKFAAKPELLRERDRSESQSAAADLLSEAW
ncbi:MAG: hypothetical protein IH623_25130 [Verrucomicrobia bacterium]|nr:hypothetical protein [Verrucomicrobiota bacterium]